MNFLELHGDRWGGDDPAILAGLAELDGETVMVIAQERGGTPEESAASHRGMAYPEGYRKSLRLMHLAAKFGIPVVTLIDGPGAQSDYESEQHSRAQLAGLLEAALEQGCLTDAVVAESLAQARQLWQLRENIPLAQALEGLNIKHDIAIPISRIAAFVQATDRLLQQALPGVRLVNFGHLGDGNLHYNVQAPQGGNAAGFLQAHEEQVNTLVFDSVARFGGSISAEHGVGSLKVDKLEKHKPAAALGMMRAIKRALDPTNLMNPGRVLRV